VVATTEEMKWGITGGSGQLARSIVDLLLQADIPHIAWSRSEVDVTDPSSVAKISEHQPTVLVNCAAWTNVDGAEDSYVEALKVNRDGAMNAAIAAKQLNIPLIHISTDYVFSGSISQPWRTNDATEPASKYGITKLQGEEAVQEIWSEGSYIFRTAWLYGPYGKNFVKTVLKKALGTSDPVLVVNDQTGQPTSTLDLASRIIESVTKQIPAGIYHATNSGNATWWEFACELFELSGQDINRVKPVTSQQFGSKTKRPTYSVLDHSQWSKVGMKEMRDWRIALRDSIPRILESVERESLLG
jgi:dTDP-4-dehydrorhamnose reductase